MKSMIPQKYKVLSGSVLKIIAVVAMVIDHTASVLLRKSTLVLVRVGKHSLSLYQFMRSVGRLSFPLYAFLLVEGFLHTHDRKKYAGRIFLFALVSEIPWNLEHAGTWYYSGQNVFFTLFLGLIGLCVVERIEDGQGKPRDAGVLGALLLASIVFHADYGCAGFGFILMLYLFREKPLFRAVIGCGFLPNRWQAGLGFIPIALYNGKRGFIKGKQSIVFYAVYPLHLLILYWIKLKIMGY